jgi:hypothetical protein
MSCYIKCGVCWEEKCDHWIFTSMKPSGLFSTIEHIITCGICSSRQKVKPSSKIQLAKCECKDLKRCIFYSNSNYSITIDSMKNLLGYYIRSKCIECKSSGIVSKNKFKHCPNCLGSGGSMWLKCLGLGFNLTNYYTSSSTATVTDNCKFCTIGYSIICYQCKGAKVILDGEADFHCSSCI